MSGPSLIKKKLRHCINFYVRVSVYVGGGGGGGGGVQGTRMGRVGFSSSVLSSERLLAKQILHNPVHRLDSLTCTKRTWGGGLR